MSEKDPCPCGSGTPLDACCKLVIDGTVKAQTAEALMRSRYTAYALREVDYLESTLHPSELEDFDKDGTAMWAKESTWMGLEIVNTSDGAPDDKEGVVEFKARFKRAGIIQEHHEVSRFRKTNGTWFYNGGKEAAPVQYRRDAPKIGRNDPCSCGSGKKYKKCCGK